jgi:hypothetical protein
MKNTIAAMVLFSVAVACTHTNEVAKSPIDVECIRSCDEESHRAGMVGDAPLTGQLKAACSYNRDICLSHCSGFSQIR